MKYLFVLLFVTSANLLSAQVVSGLYTGTLTNDSTKKEQRYELALSEYRGKITGYAYTTFVRNDSLFYSVKRVKAIKKNNQLIVEDDKMIVNNFPEFPAKGVHQTNYIRLTNEDTLQTANGNWQTNRVRKTWYAVGGNVSLQLDNDSAHSALIAQLKELNIISPPRYETAATKVKVKEDKVTVKPEPQKNEIAKTSSAIPYTERKKNIIQSIAVSSDSLQLSFYDNGVIDGDSISVYVNGETIIANNKLTATATKKTIKLPNAESIEIILVAENLGTIPPNTGLLVVRDGDKTYQINFSADLQTNATLIFKRRLK